MSISPSPVQDQASFESKVSHQDTTYETTIKTGIKEAIKQTADLTQDKIMAQAPLPAIQQKEDLKNLQVTITVDRRFLESYAKTKKEKIDPDFEFNIKANGSFVLRLGNEYFRVVRGGELHVDNGQGRDINLELQSSNPDDIKVHKALAAIQAALKTETWQDKPVKPARGFWGRLFRRR